MRHAARQLPAWLTSDVGRKMKTIACLLTGFLISHSAFATEQYAERIFVDGQDYALLSFPLEKYFFQRPEKRPGLDTASTALYRGYIGHYAIAESKLLLRDIVVGSASGVREWESVVNRLFPNTGVRWLTFFTGLLVIPLSTNVVRIPDLSDKEKYRLIAVRRGRVVADRIFSVEEYKEYLSMNRSLSGRAPRHPQVSEKAWAEGNFPIYFLHRGHVEERLVDYKEFKPNQSPQRNAGAGPAGSNDASPPQPASSSEKPARTQPPRG